MTRFAEIAVDAPTGHDRTFSYSVPPSLDLSPGQVIHVPFGPRKLQGVVFSLPSVPQVAETRDVLEAYEGGPALTETQLQLARWMSRYYLCTLFEAAALMLPPGGRLRLKTYYVAVPVDEGREGLPLTDLQERVLRHVRGRKRVAEDRLVAVMGDGARTAVRRLAEKGLVTSSQQRAGSVIGPRQAEYVEPAADRRCGLAVGISDMGSRTPRRAALLQRFLDDTAPMPITTARKEFGVSAVRGLLDKGWLARSTRVVDRDPLEGMSVPPASPVSLTPTQGRAASRIRAALDGRPATGRFLLHGVTGSGKTEVYLDATEHCLRIGKRAIVLVPEIALTPQTIERFASRFPDNVAVLHSGLTAGQRFDQWWKVRRGEYGVVVGSRGACFAPQPDLGLIVIDEEHEWTYKQHDASPRYHAKDVSVRLAELSDAVVVMGSASPDVATYRSARRDASRLLKLPDRVAPGLSRASRAPLAATEVVDMRRELREGHSGSFSRPLLREMGRCLDSGSQAILFLNRRGSASYLQCRACGHSLKCRRCDMSMTYHGDVERVLCHYCGDRRKPPVQCPRCRAAKMAYYGVGTQAVADEVSRRFPGARVQRWDRDAITRPAEYARLLRSFRSGEADVLVGTQMIAKGLHFPEVTLVGVVSADVGLNLPDYRAGERTFQLLYQVSGRSGRGASEGRVVIQTYQPDNYAIRAAAAQDYERFYGEELANRREQGNPPFSTLVRLRYSHTNRAECEGNALRLSERLRLERDAGAHSDIEVLGPTPAYPARVRGHHRWQVVLRGSSPRALLEQIALPQGWTIDVDPVGP